MDKMKMESMNLNKLNIERLEELFPNCITEGKDTKGNITKKVNFDLLRQMLSEEILDGDEAYEFNWVGKKQAILDANTPIRKTLRPHIEKSVDWNTTENIYIEGDNLYSLQITFLK